MKKSFNLNILSKYRNSIYGVAIFWITLFHAHAINQVDFSFGHGRLSIFATVMHNGSVGVDCFLFLSGICQYFSFYRAPIASKYLTKRIKRIWIPVIVINGWYWLILLSRDCKGWDFISRLFMLRFWERGDQSIWFVSLILVLYIAYPFIYKIIYKNESGAGIAFRTAGLMSLAYVGITMAATRMPEMFMTTEIATTRIPVFLLGCGCGKLIYDGKELNAAWKMLPLLAFAVFIGEVHINLIQSYPKRLFFLIGGVSLAFSLAIVFDSLTGHGQKKSVITNFFSKIGEFSLEIYLSAGIWNQILRQWSLYKKGSLFLYLGMLLVAYIFAYKAYRIERVISTNLEERKCLQE